MPVSVYNTYESTKRLLDSVHHSAIRIATGAFRTTPTASLLVEAHEPPLALRRELLGLRYALKLRQFPSHPTFKAVFSRATLLSFGGRDERAAGVVPSLSVCESGVCLRTAVFGCVMLLGPEAFRHLLGSWCNQWLTYP